MTNFKAIVLDLDGTLLNGDGKILAKTKLALQKEMENGTKIILATGRPVNMTLEFHKELGLETPMICLNGAVVFDRLNGKVISYEALKKQEIAHIYKLVSNEAKLVLFHTAHANFQMKNELELNVEDYYPIEPLGSVPSEDEQILKISAYMHDRKRYEAIMALEDDYQIAEWPDNIEITKMYITKWHSLQFVLEQLNISSSETIAFGDGANDIAMIKNVGLGVAMGNAIPKLIEVCHFVTTTNEEEGIYQFLNKNLIDSKLLHKAK
ncbi:Cof-type HAD-IIB family hydrolase [Anaerobacillus isosaccharinicus]|uniref:Cof-type HAD-IIB family hydrolase n=1 Tax=Anaerobacillus isosaccharinicus TaxID=1532552 RepID=A0A1S2LKY9_9BACI|nr:Cof-type HAD-IIB family hydrolase [Anaerobacillus isosaccharinicus]MBA5588330.1 Cof-type HAD-IIB family hydrolase [Anaerobacillus isosaccharinicus]QOY38235.1 Cof-type HAD-IIB family hydrolase [Anaerobacillus isosaccharinicus]